MNETSIIQMFVAKLGDGSNRLLESLGGPTGCSRRVHIYTLCRIFLSLCC